MGVRAATIVFETVANVLYHCMGDSCRTVPHKQRPLTRAITTAGTGLPWAAEDKTNIHRTHCRVVTP
jgi:hypothetical protein